MKLLIAITLSLFLPFMLSAQDKKTAEIIFEGNYLFSHGNYDRAIEKYRNALSIDENSSLANFELANTFLATKNYGDAIKFSRKVIEMNSGCGEVAWIVLGRALDGKGQTKQAIKAFEQGLGSYTRSYLLNYYLAEAEYRTGDSKNAERSAIRAIMLNPGFAGSHLVLANIMNARKERLKAMLPLDYFLMLEPNSERSLPAYNLLKSMMDEGMEKKAGNDVSISITSPTARDTIWTKGEMMISLLMATRYLDKEHPKTDLQFFADMNRNLFSILGDIKKNNKGIWWDLYVTKFNDLVATNNWEAFTYYISQSSNSEEVKKWMAENPEKMKAFNNWNNN